MSAIYMKTMHLDELLNKLPKFKQTTFAKYHNMTEAYQ